MDNKSDELENAILKTIKQGEQYCEQGREITENAQSIVDLGKATIVLNRIAPDLPGNECQISDWKNLGISLQSAIQGNVKNYIPSIYSSAGTVIVSIVDIYNPKIVFDSVSSDELPAAKEAIATLHRILFRKADENLLIDLMKKFGLDSTKPDKKSPIDLYLSGLAAFKGPVIENNPISTSLLPIREAIESAINKLLMQRQQQEKAKSWHAKIISIGNQLKLAEIQIETFESLASRWDRMLDKNLSSAKDQNITRDEWDFRIKELSMWFISFLESIDLEKVRFSMKIKTLRPKI